MILNKEWLSKPLHLKPIKTHEIGENPISNGQRLDCIYDDEPLVFENDPLASDKRI